MKKRPAFALLCLASAAGGEISVAAGPEHVPDLPPAAAPTLLEVAPVHETVLPNGLRVIVVERPGLPLLSATLLIRGGAQADSPHLPGLAEFTAQMLLRGTPTRSAPQIAQGLEALGTTIETKARAEAIEITLSMLAENGPATFRIVSDLLQHPNFAPAEVERERRESLEDLQLALEQPGSVASRVARRVVFGLQPAGRPASGTAASLARLQSSDCRDFHTRFFLRKMPCSS